MIKSLVRMGGCALALLAAGCMPGADTDLRREITRLNDAIVQKDRQLAAQKSTIDELNQRLAASSGVGEKQLAKIVYPDRLEIDKLSGGFDEDGKPGDDGVVVYLKPIDKSGDAIKVVGDIRIQLYDLANPPDETFVGEITVPADKVGELWYGKLMTYHYTIKCPWKSGPPKHPDITVRATFVNYLPQRVVTAQEMVRVKPAP